MAQKTLTAPLAILKRNGKAIASIRGFNVQESYQRGSVQGLGNLTRVEVPPVLITCTASFDFYLVNFKDSAINDAIKRGALTLQDFADNFILQDGISVDIYRRKGTGNTNAQGLLTAELEIVGTIKNMFINSDSMSLSEGGIGSRSQAFEYLEPILYKEASI
jgi:hypothetical protein